MAGFCQFCGSSLGEASETCPKCGKTVPAARTDAPAGNDFSRQASVSLQDGRTLFKGLITDPVTALAGALGSLGEHRAKNTGIVLSLGFAVAAAAGFTAGTNEIMAGLSFFTRGAFGGGSGLGNFLEWVLRFLVLPAAIAGVSYGVRRVLGAPAPLATDILTAGAAVVPMGLSILVAGILGVTNIEVALILTLFSLSYLVLLLFIGLTRLGGISDAAGAPAVPVVLLLSGWVVSIALRAI